MCIIFFSTEKEITQMSKLRLWPKSVCLSLCLTLCLSGPLEEHLCSTLYVFAVFLHHLAHCTPLLFVVLGLFGWESVSTVRCFHLSMQFIRIYVLDFIILNQVDLYDLWIYSALLLHPVR